MCVNDSTDSGRCWRSGTLLAWLCPAVQHMLLAAGYERRYERGGYLLHEDEEGDHAFLIVSGSVKIVQHSWSGECSLLGIRMPGELVGEMTVLNGGSRRSASAVACEPTVARVITGGALRDLIRTNPQLSLGISAMIAWWLAAANRKRYEARNYGPDTRVARTLIELAMYYGGRRAGHWELGVRLTQAEIGSLAGIAQRTTERELAKLEHSGLIARGYRGVEIVDMESLRRRADWQANPPAGVFP